MGMMELIITSGAEGASPATVGDFGDWELVRFPVKCYTMELFNIR